MKLADLIAANHNIILLLPRFGIPLGFGEKSVRDVCSAHNVPADFMVLICNVYTYDDYLPDIKQLAATDMRPLATYLKESHRYYTLERLPHIEEHLHHIADRIGGRYEQILKQFYADFRNEIEAHFQCEEQYDFPRLLSLQEGIKGKSIAMSHSQKSHGGLVDKLNDLTQIVYKYLPGNVLPEETMELVFDILQLSADIQKHALIEEKILIPYVNYLERSLK
jgi:regulator of cell morphogenesis and NO signaling